MESIISASEIKNRTRVKFAESGLSYSLITSKELSKLVELVETELEKFNRHNDISFSVNPFRKKDVRYKKDGSLEFAQIRVKGHYFDNREAITFNRENEFIGFCGWADITNAMPFVNAFDSWRIWMVQRNFY